MDYCEWCELECVPVGFWGVDGEYVAPYAEPICDPCYDAVRTLIRAGVVALDFTSVLRQRIQTEKEGNK